MVTTRDLGKESAPAQDGSINTVSGSMSDGASGVQPGPGAVRFSSNLQEIEPDHNLDAASTLTPDNSRRGEALSPEAQEEIRSLSKSLHDSQLQHGRMSNFAFEPVSLPVSRAPSNEPYPRHSSRDGRRSGAPSPAPSPAVHPIHTPPLTPHVSSTQHATSTVLPSHVTGIQQDPLQITPQTSDPQKSSQSTSSGTQQSASNNDHTSKHPASFFPGPSTDSLPASGEVSPAITPGASGTVTPPTAYSRPFTPAGDQNDPYARSKRPPQSRNLDSIDARFIFGGKDTRRQSAMSTGAVNLGGLPRSNSGNDLKSQEKHGSTFSLASLAGKKDHHGGHGHLHDEGNFGSGKQHGSMSDLKRFLRLGHSKEKRSQSPAASVKSSLNKSGVRTPPYQQPPNNLPFADDHGLESRYGKFGKVLGSGAGGSVRLMKRSSDGVTFAVKQFRDRHTYESEREYNKKVTAEFCIGSTLHHGNIIETLDIIQERGHWYEVMEYAPYDLFAIVMTGKMSREEVACSFLQIFAGVTYLHSMGLAHRDLKLDNVVVNEHGIMKLIDFGSATVYRYPFENDIVLATGVVGSDPYLAPEVYDNQRYDPQPVDVWSLAIIFACMSLRRFPWKAPRVTDNSYKLFISPPTEGTLPAEGGVRRTSEQRPKSVMNLPAGAEDTRRRSAPHAEGPQADGSAEPQLEQSTPGPRIDAPTAKSEAIRGPWRLLRLLPRESRSIIGRMLEINPRRRATLEEMMEDSWVNSTPVCRQIEAGAIVRAPGHEHTLEPGSPDPTTTVRK